MVECRGLYKLLRSGSNALVAHEEIFLFNYYFFLFVRNLGWKVISKLNLFLLKFEGVLPELNLILCTT